MPKNIARNVSIPPVGEYTKLKYRPRGTLNPRHVRIKVDVIDDGVS